eukprot:m.112506 g.112506  ORF g.112506 m.112506 type:complete len:1344 (+) comp10785_c0_seq1:262-4293(+)
MATPGLKRLRRELKSAIKTAEEDRSIEVCIDGDNLTEWHFLIKGGMDTVYTGGLYWGKMTFPEDYPVRPPAVYFFTPNGRYEVGTRLCLHGISDFHSEDWNPAISIVSLLRSVRHSMRDESVGIGSITESDERRAAYARQSLAWNSRNADFCRLFPGHVAKSETGLDTTTESTPEGTAEAAAQDGTAIKTESSDGTVLPSPDEDECIRALAHLRAGEIRDLCRMLGQPLDNDGPLECTAVRQRGVDALLAAVTAAKDAADAGPALPSMADDAGVAHGEVRQSNEDTLFELIEKRDLTAIDMLCRADPSLIHAVRRDDGKTPTIVAAIHRFADGVWYFVERGAAYKHHSPADAGFSGHHVSELMPCETALENLARLGDGNGEVWNAVDIVCRFHHGSDVFSALGDSVNRADRTVVPLPNRDQFAGPKYVLKQVQELVDAADDSNLSPAEVASIQAEIDHRLRYLLDLALTFSSQTSVLFLELGGVETFGRMLATTPADVDGRVSRHSARRFHAMALTTLHICLHVMKTVRGGDTSLLDKMLSARMSRVLMALVQKCCDIADAVVPGDPDTYRMHAQRTCAAAFQSLTEVSFNNFDSNWLATSFPEDEVLDLVTTVAMVHDSTRADGWRPRRFFLADKACSEMLAWWITNLLDAGLFTCIPKTRAWAEQIASAILQVHPRLSKADCLFEAATEYGKSSVARAACDGNVPALIASLEADPDAMFEPNAIGQPALIAAASTGNKSVCDCIIALVERGSALKYHENLPHRGRHHITKFVENADVFEDLTVLSESSTSVDDPHYQAERARLIKKIRQLFAPPVMAEARFEELVASQTHGSRTVNPDDVCFLCTETMSSGPASSLLQLQPCGHWHHIDCAKRWLLGNRATCPRCDKATVSAWPEPPLPPALPADSIKRAIQILRESIWDRTRCALALRILADSALTHRRRALRIVELNTFAVMLDACKYHSEDATVLYSAALVCLEVAISLKDVEYMRISMGTISTIRVILQSAIRSEPLRREETANWEQVVERSIQVLAELSLSPQLPKISEQLLRLEMNGLALHALSRFPGAEAIRMTEIFLTKVVVLTEELSGDAAGMLAEDCHAKAGLLLLEILKTSRLVDYRACEKMASGVDASRRKVVAWLEERDASTKRSVGVGGSSGADQGALTTANHGASAAPPSPEASPPVTPANNNLLHRLSPMAGGRALRPDHAHVHGHGHARGGARVAPAAAAAAAAGVHNHHAGLRQIGHAWVQSLWSDSPSAGVFAGARHRDDMVALDACLSPFNAHHVASCRPLVSRGATGGDDARASDPTDAGRLAAELPMHLQRLMSPELAYREESPDEEID